MAHDRWGTLVDDVGILSQLEALAHRLGIEVRYEPFEGQGPWGGGFCRLRGKRLIIVNERLPTKGRMRMLANSLKRFDLRNVYVRPALRDILENQSTDDAAL